MFLLTGTKHKETETNTKIVDLVKHSLDETKYHVMLSFSVSRCGQTLCEMTIHLLVQTRLQSHHQEGYGVARTE